jgi:hypothetical protein
VLRDRAVDAEDDRLRLTRQRGDSQRSLDPFDVDAGCVDDSGRHRCSFLLSAEAEGLAGSGR